MHGKRLELNLTRRKILINVSYFSYYYDYYFLLLF